MPERINHGDNHNETKKKPHHKFTKVCSHGCHFPKCTGAPTSTNPLHPSKDSKSAAKFMTPSHGPVCSFGHFLLQLHGFLPGHTHLVSND